MKGLFALQVRLTLLVALALVAVVGYNTHPVQTALTTALLIPEAIPDVPVRPLLAFTDEPATEHVRYPYQGGEAEGQLFLPANEGRYGAAILFLGINPDLENPHMLRISQALARAGIVALVPTPVELIHGRINYGEVDALVGAFNFLQANPKVDPERVGIVGFSVGSSIALVAAADPRISDQIRFVNAFGGYFSAETLFIAMTTRQIEVGGQPQTWEPHHDAQVWFAQQFINNVEDDRSRALLEKAFVSGGALSVAEIASLSINGRAVYAALINRDPRVAAQVYQALPQSLREAFNRLSPQSILDRLKTNVYVMHDRSDTYIPFTESRRLVRALAGYPHLTYTEFSLFQHVEPTKNLPLQDMFEEVAKLYGHMYRVVGEVK